jgi:hypothetical protein
MSIFFARLCAIALMSALSCLSAEIRVLESTFAAGDDGWTVGDFFNNTHGLLPEFVPFGGVSDGYIQAIDLYGYNAFHAPDAWLGNQSRMYGGMLHVHQRVASSDGVNQPLVVLGSGPMRLQYFERPPGTEWVEYRVPLVAEGWEVGLGDGSPGRPATEVEFRAVLSNLEWFALDADWQTGNDLVGLDEVYVTMPEPSAVILSASGLIALVAAARSRRKRY